jgi:hypothetical protein
MSPPNCQLGVGSILYFFLKKVGRLDLETPLINLFFFLFDLFDLSFNILNVKILFVIC